MYVTDKTVRVYGALISSALFMIASNNVKSWVVYAMAFIGGWLLGKAVSISRGWE